MLKINEF